MRNNGCELKVIRELGSTRWDNLKLNEKKNWEKKIKCITGKLGMIKIKWQIFNLNLK